ncbi:MAG: FxsA family protein [Pirellulaceae bacterium]
MFIKLLLAFTIVPLVELAILIKLSQATSLPATIGLVIFTGILGSWLAKQQGSLVVKRFRQAIGEGRVPAPEVQDGLLIFFAAGLLLTPGLLTDLVGFLLLIPASRSIVRQYMVRRFKGSFKMQTFHFESGRQSDRDDDAIDVQAWNVREEDRTSKRIDS